MINYLITFQIRPESKAAFRTMMQEVCRTLPTVTGCTGVEAYFATEAPLQLTLVERWESEAAHQAYLAHLERTGGFKALSSYLSAPPTGYYATLLAP